MALGDGSGGRCSRLPGSDSIDSWRGSEALVPEPFRGRIDDPGLAATLARLGYRNVGSDLDGRDWEEGQSIDGVVRAWWPVAAPMSGCGSRSSTAGPIKRPMLCHGSSPDRKRRGPCS